LTIFKYSGIIYTETEGSELIVVSYELFGLPQNIQFRTHSQFMNWQCIMEEAFVSLFKVKAIYDR